jgi:transglutaminase-like putative cysteine protease
MQLRITHETCYDYVPPVDIAQHVAYLQPLNNANQKLLSHSLHVSPMPAQQVATVDVYGNTRQFFSLQAAHSQLKVIARSLVSTRVASMPDSTVPWEQVRERFRYCANKPFDAAAEFVFASGYAPRHPDFAAYARPSFAPGVPLVEAARDLMQRIHRDFTYESQSTQVNTPALEALAQRKGVCQDFAHIMIACLRAFGLPARYVSGYLLTHPAPGQARLVGSDASHAWVSVYLPDLPERSDTTTGCASTRWCDFDPTNNLDGWGTPGEDYVTLALGRDYADVSPIRGVIHGGANHILSVGVTVEPDEPNQSQSQSQSSSQSQSQSQFMGAII